jgi:hypothetical protein
MRRSLVIQNSIVKKVKHYKKSAIL